jgi:competence protein ComGC
MKQEPNRASSAFTLVEVIIVIFVVLVLAALILPFFARTKPPSRLPRCHQHLKEIGIAYVSWAEDDRDLEPSQQTVAEGGWADYLTNADQGAICWTNYAIMAGDIDGGSKMLICPEDNRQPALSLTNKFSNTNVSYFVGVSASMANMSQPQSILGGDRNLGPGAVPAAGYGYSPNSGAGNDVAVPINSSNGPVSWTLRTNGPKSTYSGGNMLFGDMHVEWTTTDSLSQQSLPNTPPTTNWPSGHFPATPSIRLVFP